jgi:hypothetical protein
MPQRNFENQKALIDYAEQNGLVYVWEFAKRQRLRSPVPAFTKRQQLLSPDQYNIVDVRTSRGVRRAMLFPKAILQAEFAANAPMRERMAINRERLRAKRAAAKQRQKRGRPLEGTAPKETCHEGEIRNFTDGSLIDLHSLRQASSSGAECRENNDPCFQGTHKGRSSAR